MNWSTLLGSNAFIVALAFGNAWGQKSIPAEDRFVTYTVDAKKQDIRMYWADEHQVPFGNFLKLKTWLERRHQKLVFAMNGGMYKADHAPLGLYIEKQRTVTPLSTADGTGNFYLKPNGVFYLTRDNVPGVVSTQRFRASPAIQYATQSGPMLLIDGVIHPALKKGSANLNVRNGVGVLPNGSVVFVLSKQAVNLYDFACYFKNLGCRNALYLDGFVSRMYAPEKNWLQTDGDFGVLIGVTEKLP